MPEAVPPASADAASADTALNLTPLDLTQTPAETLIGMTVRTADGIEVGEIQALTPPDGADPGFIVIGGGLLSETVDVPIDQAGFLESQELVELRLTQDELMELGEDNPANQAPAPATPPAN
jgi:hypothetical protein